jgi:uncharacterized protein (TIGR02271 family)
MAQTQNTSGTVVGYFENQSGAERAVQALRDAGFTSAHVGVASRGANTTSSAGSTVGNTAKNAAQAVGEKTEGVWDKVKNFFDGGDVEPYSDERTQGDLANREITPDPADASRSGYGSTGLRENLTGLSVPEDRSRYFDHRFSSNPSGAIVTVNAGSRVSEVEAILQQYGGDLGENSESYDYSSAPAAATTGMDNNQNIQLLGEILRVHKDRISRGEVTLRKEVITENQTIQVPVTREELVIERRSVSGNTPADGTIGDNSTIRIPLSEETASIDKSTVVREEVSVGKKAVEEVRDLSGQVRREELIVDDTTTKAGTTNNR